MSHIHIPDGVLPLWLWAAGWILALALLFLAARASSGPDARRKVPLIGVIAALMLVAMSWEIVPIAYHVNLSVIGGILLGPPLSVIAAFIVVVVLAMLGHGGVTVAGLNAIVLGVEMVLGWALFRGAVGVLGRRHAALSTGLATVVTLALTTTMVVGLVWVAGATGGASGGETGMLEPTSLQLPNPFSKGTQEPHSPADEHGHEHDVSSLSAARFAAVAYTLGPIGWLLEALIGAAVIGYVARVRPAMVFEGALAEKDPHIPSHESAGC
ncbi:MAG: energy-coupling factor ABC transporter permease [Coriobacteriia bacterium]|jgi:cobalt/nickel transport system permease protein|nr:energy-coupling factor ABC transporter permease [Coriobacteriia bacterium]